MGINPLIVTDRMKNMMDGEVRKAMGKSGMTRAEEIAKYCRGTELREQKLFRSWLQLNELPFINPDSYKASTVAAGTPDFHVFYGERFLAIEMKAPDGVISEAQERTMDLYRRNGAEVYICHSAMTAIELTKRILRLKL